MKITVALFSLLTLALTSPIIERASPDFEEPRGAVENNVCCDAYGKVTWCFANQAPNCRAN